MDAALGPDHRGAVQLANQGESAVDPLGRALPLPRPNAQNHYRPVFRA